MGHGTPGGVYFDHRHLAMPELDRWKAAEQAHAAVVGTAIVDEKRKRFGNFRRKLLEQE